MISSPTLPLFTSSPPPVSSSSGVAPRDSSLCSRMTAWGDAAKDLGRIVFGWLLRNGRFLNRPYGLVYELFAIDGGIAFGGRLFCGSSICEANIAARPLPRLGEFHRHNPFHCRGGYDPPAVSCVVTKRLPPGGSCRANARLKEQPGTINNK